MEKAEHHRLHSLVPQTAHRRADLADIERLEHGTLGVQTLAHFEAPSPGHKGRRLLQVYVVEPGADLPADLEDVAEAAGHEHAYARRLAFDNGVGRHRGGVDHRRHVASFGPAFRETPLQRGHETLGGVFRRGEDLDHPRLAGLAIHEGGVGEGASDVDAHPPRGHGRHAHPARVAAVAAASRPVAGSTTTP